MFVHFGFVAFEPNLYVSGGIFSVGNGKQIERDNKIRRLSDVQGGQRFCLGYLAVAPILPDDKFYFRIAPNLARVVGDMKSRLRRQPICAGNFYVVADVFKLVEGIAVQIKTRLEHSRKILARL